MKKRKLFVAGMIFTSVFGMSVSLAVASLKDKDVKAAKASDTIDLETVISSVTTNFEYSTIGQFYVNFNLSEDIFTSGELYANDHLNSFIDESSNVINISDGIIVNGHTFGYWVSYDSPNVKYSSKNGVLGDALRQGGAHSPLSLNINDSAISFRFSLQVFHMDSIVITLKSGLFKGYNSNTDKIYTLSEDLTYYTTLNNQPDSIANTLNKRVRAVKDRSDETTGVARVVETQDLGEQTADGGAKYRKYLVKTNLRRIKKTNEQNDEYITQSFAADNYRYMFDNILVNGRTLADINAEARLQKRDFTSLSPANGGPADPGVDTQNPAYETGHAIGSTNARYDLALYIQMPTDQPYVWFWINVPNQMKTDLGWTGVTFSIRDGSAWHSRDASGNHVMVRSDIVAFNSIIAAAVTELENYVDFESYSTAEQKAVSQMISDATLEMEQVFLKEDIDALVADTKAQIDAYLDTISSEHVNAVVNLINSIPANPTESDAAIIKNAVDAFMALTSVEQGQVPSNLRDKLYEAYSIIASADLANYKQLSKQEIDNKINLSGYREAEKQEIIALVTAAKNDIDNAADNSEIDGIMAALFVAVAEKKTASQLAIETLDAIDLSAYRDEEKVKVADLINKGKSSIALSYTVEQVDSLLNKIMNVLATIKTNAQILADLANYKEFAKQEVETSVVLEQYKETQKEEIEVLMANAKTAIDACTNEEGVNTALTNFYTAVGAKKTAKQLALDELDSIDLTIYREKERVKANAIIASGKTAIAVCSNIEDIDFVLDSVRGSLANIKTGAQLTEELGEYKTVVKNEIDILVDLDLYRENEKNEIEDLLEEALASIEAANSKEAVDGVVDALFVAISLNKTAKQLAIEELEAFDLSVYREAEQNKAKEIINKGKAAILNCQTASEVDALLGKIKNVLGAIQTDAGKSAYEALADAREAAIKKINDKYDELKTGRYTNANRQQLDIIKDNAVFAVSLALTESEINAVVTEAIAALNAVKRIDDPDPDDPEEPEEPEEPAKKCGGDIMATSIILSSISLIGVVLLVFKKKKEE